MMSTTPQSVLTMGLGTWGTVNLLVTLGLGVGAASVNVPDDGVIIGGGIPFSVIGGGVPFIIVGGDPPRAIIGAGVPGA